MITHPALVGFFIILDVAYFENDAKDMCDQGCMKLSYFENEKEKSIFQFWYIKKYLSIPIIPSLWRLGT